MTRDATFSVWTAILAMGAVTLALRLAGFWMMGHVPLTPRFRRALEALPGSVIMATVLPVVVKGGPVAMLAIGSAVAVMLLWKRDILAVLTAMAIAAAMRFAGFG